MAAGGTWDDSGVPGFTQADTTITARALRVKMSGDRTITLGGVNAESDIGVSHQCAAYSGWGTAGDQCSVMLYGKPGTIPMTAAGAIAQNATVFPAASGKIDDVAVGAPLGIAMEAASGDGSIIEVLPFPRGYGAPRKITDPGNGGAIPVTHSGVCSMTSTGADTRTLAVPTFDGQELGLCHDVDGGSIAVTVASGINEAGNTTITFTDVDEAIFLKAVRKAGVLRWQVVGNGGTTLS